MIVTITNNLHGMYLDPSLQDGDQRGPNLGKWDARFLDLAALVGSWSKDPSTRVGAAITDSRNRVISLGFNGPPRGVEDDPTIDRETKLRRTLHAEQNALSFANRDVAGCTLYVTHHPCARCAAQIAQHQIWRVVCRAPDPTFAARWADDIAEAKLILQQSGVTLVALE